MAIAFDTSSLATLAAAPVTLSHTCTGSNLILWAAFAGSTNYPTGATYNSVAMTRVSDFIHPTVPDYHMSLFYLNAPATGANNIVVSGTGSFTIEGSSFTGANQTGIDTSTTNSGTATGLTTNITVGTNAWIVTMVGNSTGGSTSGTNYTQRQVTGDNAIGDSNGALSGATSVTVNTSNNNAVIVASFLPVAAAVTPHLRSLLGVGL